jgi:hypothetical protein
MGVTGRGVAEEGERDEGREIVTLGSDQKGGDGGRHDYENHPLPPPQKKKKNPFCFLKECFQFLICFVLFKLKVVYLFF